MSTATVPPSPGVVRLSAGTVVTSDAVLSPGWVEYDGEHLTAVGGSLADPASDATVNLQLPDCILVPGFVDLHVHGGGGGSFTAHDGPGVMRAVDFHRQHGTTTSLASLVTGELDALRSSIEVLACLVEAGELAGIHLEGPWLSADQCGAHDSALLRLPDPAEVNSLLAAGRGTIRMVTLAPELPGALAAIGEIVRAGAIAAIGHTAADYVTTVAAVDAGATVATHLFNAMTPVHHRDPGPIAALLTDPRVTLELINDGVHLHAAIAPMVERAAGVGRIALVTDAMAATGMPDGHYLLGSVSVDVNQGIATVAGTETIAGSTATMDALFRRAVGPLPAEPAALRRASTMTAHTPAHALGLTDVGQLSPGSRADIVVLDANLAVRGVRRRGTWVRPLDARATAS